MTGETKPRPDTLTNLAAILSVSVEWLSLGINPEISESERRRRSINANGAANIVAGFIALSGGNAALPDEDQTDVDLIAILGGRQIKLEAPFINIVSGKGKLLVSKSHAKHTVVAVAKVSPCRSPYVLHSVGCRRERRRSKIHGNRSRMFGSSRKASRRRFSYPCYQGYG